MYSQTLGLKSAFFLIPQANAAYVRRNLLYSGGYVRADIHHLPRLSLLVPAVFAYRTWPRLREARAPYTIPAGASNPLSMAGYVNAALELKDQMGAGTLPVPNRIHVALGSGVTAVGLALGLRAAGLDTTVMAARVSPVAFLGPAKVI